MSSDSRRKLWSVAAVTALVIAFTVLWGIAIGAPLDVALVGGALGVAMITVFEQYYVQSAAGAWFRNLRPILSVPLYAAVLCAMLFLVQHASHFATGRLPQLEDAYARLPFTIPLAFVIGIIAVTAYRIIEQVATERVEAAALARELEVAREIQFSMLPDAESIASLPSSIDLKAVLEPAGSVGGDLFDAFMLDQSRLYFMVGDVSGKGVPAALFMAVTKALSKSVLLRDAAGLETAVAQIHKETARENKSDLFVSALFGVLHLDTGSVDMCNAGHENPIVIRKNGEAFEQPMEGGPPLCVVEGFSYLVETITLKRGDTLLIITDGIAEARAPDGELFGRHQPVSAFDGKAAPQTANEALETLVGSLRTFRSGRDLMDDLTVMAIRFIGTD